MLPHRYRVRHAAQGSRQPLGKVIGPIGTANATPLDESGRTGFASSSTSAQVVIGSQCGSTLGQAILATSLRCGLTEICAATA